MGVWAVWREDERWTAHSQGGSVVDGELGLVDCRAPGIGRRVLVPASSAEGSPVGKSGSLEELEEAPLSAYTIRRYLRGVPEGQRELKREDVLPLNANIDLMGGIDFKKGCYTGQELTIRTHHTGVVRRRILPVSLYGLATGVPETLDDTDIKKQDKRNRATGKFIAGIGNIGLAMCRLEQMTDLVVSSEGSTVSVGDKFAAQSADGAELGIKAFVPDWLRGQIRAPKIQKRV
ncbi:ccr4 associated factor [Oleoguttula sp. CCFEE 5521]